ncbi:hypothetical protein [Caulobacter sp. Root343]|uniref:hypothetical protein n=1 Tax=Caulobacter sp. Root343 TaxID=1736520 RepID=UPI0006FB9FA1|nr:hypothetical protein [Caulobacter sp. Root343]KQV66647.1 hypothetical protein ASC70_12500 [Caulobacter sp. Root343]
MKEPIPAVIYEALPNDPTSGRILWATQAPPGALMLETRPWIATDLYDAQVDQTHKVEAGRLVQTHQWVLDEQGRRLRVEPLEP